MSDKLRENLTINATCKHSEPSENDTLFIPINFIHFFFYISSFLYIPKIAIFYTIKHYYTHYILPLSQFYNNKNIITPAILLHYLILPPSHQVLYSFLFGMSHPILYIPKLTKNSQWVPPLPNFSSLFTLLLLPFHTTFTPLSLFYSLKIDGSHHFTHFSSSFPLLYTYFLTSVPKPNVKNWLGRRE